MESLGFASLIAISYHVASRQRQARLVRACGYSVGMSSLFLRSVVAQPRLVWFGLWLLLSCAGPAELRLPDVRQTTDYTCSASALQAVLLYYGEETGEVELAAELGATPQDGAPPEAIVRVARAHGFMAEVRENLQVEDLAQAVRAGVPVIVALQAWPKCAGRGLSPGLGGWALRRGDCRRARPADLRRSNAARQPRRAGPARIQDRWHDQDGHKRWLRSGIFIRGKPPAATAAPAHRLSG